MVKCPFCEMEVSNDSRSLGHVELITPTLPSSSVFAANAEFNAAASEGWFAAVACDQCDRILGVTFVLRR
jgi:hypothetical protein